MTPNNLLRQFMIGFRTAETNFDKTVRTGIPNDYLEDFLKTYGKELRLLNRLGNVDKNRLMADRRSVLYYLGNMVAFVRYPIKFLYTFRKAMES